MNSFFTELRRRNVVKVGAAYVIIAWVIAQVAELALDSFEAPAWVIKTILLLLALGLPLVLTFAWAFELTPEGIKREADVDRSKSVATETGRKLSFVIAGAAVFGVGIYAWDAWNRGEAPPRQGVPTAENRSVAVLPFDNMSGDPEQEYFSDGITEEIINAVVKIPGLSVPARTSVFAFEDTSGDIREIGASLGVAHVLEGSVRSQGNQVRITAQLIKVDDGFHLWSETFDRKLENIFAVQEEIAAAIAKALVGKLGSNIETVPNQTRNMSAYDTYLKGRAALRRRDDEAVEILENAAASDPDFAPAWAALAIAYQSITEDDLKAIETARRALALDSNNVDALNAMGGALRRMRRWLEAEPYFDQALAIDPNSSELLEDYAEFLSYVGRTTEALTVSRRGMEIDARLLPLVFAHVDALASNGHAKEAYDIAEHLVSTGPLSAVGTYWYLIWVLRSPDLDPALLSGEIPTDLGADAPSRQSALLEAAARVFMGDRDETAINLLKENYRERSQFTYFDTQLVHENAIARDALVYANEFDYVIEQDIQWAKKIDTVMHEFGWTPFYAKLRAHPRYGDYLEAAGIVAYWDATQWPDWCERSTEDVIRCR